MLCGGFWRAVFFLPLLRSVRVFFVCVICCVCLRFVDPGCFYWGLSVWYILCVMVGFIYMCLCLFVILWTVAGFGLRTYVRTRVPTVCLPVFVLVVFLCVYVFACLFCTWCGVVVFVVFAASALSIRIT